MTEATLQQYTKECASPDELQPRKITAPRRYSCYQQLLSSGEDTEDDNKNSVKKRKRKQKMKIAEVYSGIPEQQNVSEHDTSNKFDLNKPLMVEDVPKRENKSAENKKCSSNAFVCSECGKVLRSKDTLLRHKISHSGLKPFVCSTCDQGFSSAVSLKEHKARHDNKKLYECNICSKCFRQNSCYHRHLATHSRLNKHMCHICNRQFSLKDYLRSHMKTHSSERQYVCDQCHKAFARVSDLNRHKILHTGDRPYMCDVCGISFADSSSCRRHVKDHTISKKLQSYSCDHCSSSFKKLRLLNQHLLKKHKISQSCDLNAQNNSSTEKSNNEVFRNDDVMREPDFCDGNMLLSGSGTLPCPELTENYICEQPLLSREPLNENENCVNYLCSNNYNENFLSVSNNTSVFKEVVREMNVSSYENVGDKFYPEVSDIPKSQIHVGLSEEISSHSRVDYVMFPDFNSQAYYTWLSNFTSLCKILTFPIESDLFNKISLVHKTLADVLAEPSGLLCSKNNFKVLRKISDDLYNVTNGHLDFIFEHLRE